MTPFELWVKKEKAWTESISKQDMLHMFGKDTLVLCSPWDTKVTLDVGV
jgi:hypothetical protein